MQILQPLAVFVAGPLWQHDDVDQACLIHAPVKARVGTALVVDVAAKKSRRIDFGFECAIERQIQILKGMGSNGIRTSHNPPAPELLDLADRMGMLVMKWMPA